MTQTVIALLAALLVFGLLTGQAAAAVAAGSLVCIAGTVFFAIRVFLVKQMDSADRFLRRLYVAEIQKMALTVIAFYAIIRWTELGFAYVLLGFAVTTAAYWLVLPLNLNKSIYKKSG